MRNRAASSEGVSPEDRTDGSDKDAVKEAVEQAVAEADDHFEEGVSGDGPAARAALGDAGAAPLLVLGASSVLLAGAGLLLRRLVR